MRSDRTHEIIGAIEKVRESKDTSMLGALLYKSNDPRVTHALNNKGKSIYQMKMEAIREITGIVPPAKVTYEVDTSVIQYYLKIFKLADSSRR